MASRDTVDATLRRSESTGPYAREIDVGMLLDRHYELVEEIGRGGMGRVFKAIDRLAQQQGDPDCYVAIKILSAALQSDEAAIRGLQREANRALRITDRHVVRIHAFQQDRDNRLYFISMELLEGTSVQSLIDANPEGQPWSIVRPLIEQACQGLEEAHREEIVHSDIKPSNLLVTARDELKILDFGIAAPMAKVGESREMRSKDMRHLGFLTPAYASLEMFEGEDPRPSDDVYSIACVTYRWLSGRPPYADPEAPLETVPANKAKELGLVPAAIAGLSKAQNAALRRGLALRQRYRTQTAREFWQSMNDKSSSTFPWRRAAAAACALLLVALSYWKGWISLPIPSGTRTVPLAIQASPSSVKLFIDGRPLNSLETELQPGFHKIAALAPAYYGEIRYTDVGPGAPVSAAFTLQAVRLPDLEEFERFLKLAGAPSLSEAQIANVEEPTLRTALRAKWLRQHGRSDEADELLNQATDLRRLGDARAAVTSFLIESVGMEGFQGAERNPSLVAASRAGDAMASLFIAEAYRELLLGADGMTSRTDPRFRSYCDHLVLAVAQGWTDVANGYWRRDGCDSSS